MTIAEIRDGRTRMTIQSIFPDAAAMEQLIAMGMEEGLKQAVGQIDAVLNAKPEERRLIIEEAAGVLKYRKRKE